MSLFDALLLDPTAYHIWISVRSDKQLGSGVITDLFDGSKFGATYRFDQVMAKFASISNVVVHYPRPGSKNASATWPK